MTIAGQPKIYVFGASGTVSTTLGRSLSEALGLVHVDTDDHYWAAIDPPFSVKNTPQERVHSMKDALRNDGWVLSGACNEWGGELVEQANLIVFTSLAAHLRMERLRSREKARFGNRIEEGGDMFQIHLDFMEWAKRYDDPNFSGRNIGMHERWLAKQNKPILKVNSECEPEALVQTVIDRVMALS